MRRVEKYDAELFKACGELNLNGIKLALAKGANINAFDDFNETPLTSTIRHYSLVGMSVEECKNEKYELFEKTNYAKLLPIIDYLIDNGADIDLFGYDGQTPLLAAYYEHSVPLIEYLLKKGANPNVNCYLTDITDENLYRSTILSCIYSDCDSDDVDYEIECLVKQYGGKLYNFGYNPVLRKNTGRAFVRIWPTKGTLFEDYAYDSCGDYRALHLEVADGEFIDIVISSIDGWEEWHKEVIEDYYEEKNIKTEAEWDEWFNRGLLLAKQLKKSLPENVDLYYLYDCKPIFRTRKDGSKYWNQWDGELILIE